MVKNSLVNLGAARDIGLIPGIGRRPEGKRGKLFQDLCLENLTDRGAW